MDTIVKKYLSDYKLKSYEELKDIEEFSNKDVLEIYKINVKMSKDIYALLSYFEVFLRNRINEEMIKYFGNNWIDNIDWKTGHLTKIFEAKERINKHKYNNYNMNDIISNLSLGFWVHMFDKNYESVLWSKALNKVFSPKTSRNIISYKLQNILELRNRISHCEIIIKNKELLKKNINNILSILGAINKSLYEWIINNCEIPKI